MNDDFSKIYGNSQKDLIIKRFRAINNHLFPKKFVFIRKIIVYSFPRLSKFLVGKLSRYF